MTTKLSSIEQGYQELESLIKWHFKLKINFKIDADRDCFLGDKDGADSLGCTDARFDIPLTKMSTLIAPKNSKTRLTNKLRVKSICDHLNKIGFSESTARQNSPVGVHNNKTWNRRTYFRVNRR